MDLTEYRSSASEKARVTDLLDLFPPRAKTVLDIGARDGFLSGLLADRALQVTALDLERPSIDHAGVTCVKGDVAALHFDDSSFDVVFCAEVLEHIPPPRLSRACAELFRVASRHLVIGVPYRQDIRLGRTTCHSCGGKNPPWGHVNSFDEQRLRELFPVCTVTRTSFVGVGEIGTNALSCALLDLAGNPYGTYSQEEPCVHCGAALVMPAQMNLLQRVLTRAAFYLRDFQALFVRPRANWIHLQLEKRVAMK